MARLIGAPQLRNLLPAAGVREVIHGAGILAWPKSGGWMWTRIPGDMMDLKLLTDAYRSRNSNRASLKRSIAFMVGITLLDLFAAVQRSRRTIRKSRTLHMATSVTIDRTPEEVYQTWHHFENLSRIMPHIVSARSVGKDRTHWVAKGPAGKNIDWYSETTEDRPNERIAWRSLPGTRMPNSGLVTFEPAPAGQGTLVKLEMWHTPPGGLFGNFIAKLFRKSPEQVAPFDLRRFKQVMETDQVVETEG